MKKYWQTTLDYIHKIGINTWLLLLILMMMFGEYSQRYYPESSWGKSWHMEVITPIVYYASGILAILFIIIIGILLISKLISEKHEGK